MRSRRPDRGPRSRCAAAFFRGWRLDTDQIHARRYEKQKTIGIGIGNNRLNIMQNGQKGIAAPRSASDDDVIDLNFLLGTLWRGKHWILLVVLLAVLVGGAYAYLLATPMFQSTAVVMLNNREETVVDRGSVIGGLGSSNSVLRTEVEVLQSRALLGKVVDALNLIEDPEFNVALNPPSITQSLKTQIKELVLGAPTSLPDAVTQDRRQREGTINSLLSKTTILNLPQSLVFEITVETTSALKSAQIAETLVELYILNQLEVKFEATEQATTWLAERVTDLQIELERAESQVKDFRAETPLISPEALQGLEVQVKDMRERVENTREAQEAARALLARLQEPATPAEKAEETNDLQLQRLLPRIDEPAIREAFDLRFQQIVTRLEADIRSNETQIASLQNSLRTLEQRSQQQSADLITLEQLTREAEASRLLYEYFLGRLKETSAQQGVQQADSRVISPAVIPNGPTSPRKDIILVLSAGLGAILGSILVILRESRNHSFRTSEQVESISGYTTIGQLPIIPTKRGNRRDAIRYLKEKPMSAAVEAIRNLRTSIMLSNIDKPPQIIMICSALPGEGKTTVSLSLALNFSTMGKKVLLIEGDIRRRIVGEYLSTKQKDGVVAVLSGERRFEDVVVNDELLGCDVLLGDKGPDNAADIFSSERFEKLLTELRQHYDFIIVDTPPVLIVPDARVIAQYADAHLLVIKWDQTQKEQLLNALRQFENVGVPASGIVLNQIDPRGMKRYGYGEYYGAYTSRGSAYYSN